MAKRGRPKGTGKPEGEKFVTRAFRFPPELWGAFARAVPDRQRSKTIRGYMEKEIQKRRRLSESSG